MEGAAKVCIHFHVGSQLTTSAPSRTWVNEGARIYAKLRKMGVPLEVLRLGGGLGVDYVGAAQQLCVSVADYRSRSTRRRRLHGPADLHERRGVPEPHIVSESVAP